MRKKRKSKQVLQIDEPTLFSAEEMAEMLAVKPESISIPSTKPSRQQQESGLSNTSLEIKRNSTNGGLFSENKSNLLPEHSDTPIPDNKERDVSEDEQLNVNRITDENDKDRIVDDMVMAMGLLDAYYTPSQTRLIAMESAALAQNGINSGKIYELPAIRGRRFDGNQLIAIYYVSFARSFPSMIDRINLPLSEAYAAALEKYEK